MSSLPPYSTYRTDAKQLMHPQATSHGNILTFTPPGFRQTLNVKFPDSRLPVCYKCKKNYKTRDMCRVRNNHTAPPWTTAYVCVTMDASCTDEHGNFVDKPLTLRMMQWQPYAVKRNFGPKTPVCSACKRTNRTRGFCREKHHHRHLPWCTVYVLMSALDTADPATVVAGASKPAPESPSPVEMNGHVESKGNAGTPPTDSSHSTLSPGDDVPTPTEASTPTLIQTEPPAEGDDIHDIAASRTFLALVSKQGTAIHWLDLVDYEEQPAQAAVGFFPPHSIPQGPTRAESPYLRQAGPTADSNTGGSGQGQPHTLYAPNASSYAQQQQHALKSQQQYFFQLQQQQQQQQQLQQHSGTHHQPPPPPPPTHAYPQWQQYNPMEMPTAGEAAAARRRVEEMAAPLTQNPMWPLYAYHATAPMYSYPHGSPPPPTGYLPPHMAAPPPPPHPHHHALPHSAAPPPPPDQVGHGNGTTLADYSPPVARRLPAQEGENDEEPGSETHPDVDERDTKRLRTV